MQLTRFWIFGLCYVITFSSGIGQPQLVLEEFATGFSNPVDIAHAGDDRLFIVEQGGTIYIVDSSGTRINTPFFSRSVTSGGERGLLGLAFDPNYPFNGFFYVYYSLGGTSRISRYQVDANNPNVADPTSETPIMTISQPFSNHNGGDIAFGPDGYLYIGLGDGGSGGDPGNRSQNPQELLGKMLRIDVSSLPYMIPPTNPFVNDSTTLDEIWALGLRNPWRWSFDRTTGDMWIADVGQGAREEISYMPYDTIGGANYGWRCYEGNNTFRVNNCDTSTVLTFPVFDYPRNVGTSVTGGFVYRGVRYPILEGIYFFGDYNSGRLWGLWPDPNNPGNWLNTEFLNTNYQWSTFGEDQDGEMYGADYNSGTIYQLAANCPGVNLSSELTNTDCAGTNNGSINLSVMGAIGNVHYSWNTGDTLPNLTNLDTGRYEVMISDDNGCELSESFQIRYRTFASPTLSFQGEPLLCEGDSITLMSSSAPQGYTQAWQKDGIAIEGANNTSISVGASGQYRSIFEGVCPVPPSAEVEVVVEPFAATPDFTEDTLNFCTGENAQLSAPPAPIGYGYQWFRNGRFLFGDTAQILETNISGDYQLTYQGFCSSALSAPLTVAERPIPTVDIAQSGGNLSATTMDATVFQWTLAGTPIAGANDASYSPAEAGAYAVIVTSAFGCQATSRTINVEVVSIDTWLQGGMFTVSPNPAQTEVKLEATLKRQDDIHLTLSDLQGKILFTQRHTQIVGKLVTVIPLGDLPMGIYNITLQGSQFQQSQRVQIIE